MPFDGIADPVAAKSLQALDLMEDRLQGGRKWTRHFMFRDGGKMCLLGASYFGGNIGAGRQADRALEYSRGRSCRDRAPRTGATGAGSRRPSRTSTITVRAMAKSSAFCAPRKSWSAPTLRRHRQHKGAGPPGLSGHAEASRNSGIPMARRTYDCGRESGQQTLSFRAPRRGDCHLLRLPEPGPDRAN